MLKDLDLFERHNSLVDAEYEGFQELVAARHWAALWKQVAKEWRRAALESQKAQNPRVPVVGVLSAETTPADFKRFTDGPSHD